MSFTNDVADNFPEFKLLIRYPILTPYMYSFTAMKPKTMEGIIEIANREYPFRDDVDLMHQDDERIRIDHYLLGSKIYLKALSELIK